MIVWLPDLESQREWAVDGAKAAAGPLELCPFCKSQPEIADWCGGGGVQCPSCEAKIIKSHDLDADGNFIRGSTIAAMLWNRCAPKRGRWEYYHWCEFRCSECGEWSKSAPYRGRENYCPNCGAQMDMGEAEA